MTDAAIAYATELGASQGRDAASWYFDGNTTDKTYREVVKAIDDGDGAILDTFPFADLSGEWAGSLAGPELFRDACAEAGLDPENEDTFDGLFSEVCDAYEQAFNDAAVDAIEATARRMLAWAVL